VQHQNIVFHGLLKHIPWAIVDRLVEKFSADRDPRCLKTKAHLIAMLYAQFCGSRSLREIESNVRSHASKRYHLGGCVVSRSALSTANASRPVGVCLIRFALSGSRPNRRTGRTHVLYRKSLRAVTLAAALCLSVASALAQNPTRDVTKYDASKISGLVRPVASA